MVIYLKTQITAIGPDVADLAEGWVRDIGHVVISFNGAGEPERPGEICAGVIEPQALIAALSVNQTLTIED